jgi:AcrR family transcriptional regulator
MGIQERKKREKEIRRKQIQNAAREIFLLKGYISTTMEDIANEVELSPATIYLYFKSKEDLFASLLKISLEYLYKGIEMVHKNKRMAAEKKIIKIKEVMFAAFKSDNLMFRNVYRLQVEDTLPTLSHEVLTEINEVTRKIIHIIANIYEDGVREGKFIKSKSVIVADVIWGLFSGLAMWEEAKRKLNPRKDFLKSTLDDAFYILLRGIQ